MFKLPPMAFCKDLIKLTFTSDVNPIVKALGMLYKRGFPGLPQSCPILPGIYHEINRSAMIVGYLDFPPNPLMGRFYLPNGRHSAEMQFSTTDNTSSARFEFIFDIQNNPGAEIMI
jgi:hypothetical protein